MSEEREKRSSEEPDDVEAHKLNQRLSETEEKDKFAATDEDDVEAHVLNPKLSSGKMQA